MPKPNEGLKSSVNFYTDDEPINTAEDIRDSLLVRKEATSPMEKYPWIGDAIRGLATGAGYVGAGIPGAGIANYMYNELSKEAPGIFGPPVSPISQGLEIATDPLLSGIGKVLKPKLTLLKKFGRSPNAQQLFDPIEQKYKGALPTFEWMQSRRIPLTVSQVTESPRASGMEATVNAGFPLDDFLQKQNTEFLGAIQDIKGQSGLSPKQLTRSASSTLVKEGAKANVNRMMGHFGRTRRALQSLADKMIPPQQIQTGTKPVEKLTPYGRKKVLEPIYEEVRAPIQLTNAREYASSAIEDLNLVSQNPHGSPALQAAADELKTMLTPFAKGRKIANFEKLDALRASLGDFIERHGGDKNIGRLQGLYRQINDDIDSTLGQYQVLGKQWKEYRQRSADFLKSRYSNVGKAIDPTGWDNKAADEFVNKAFASSKDFQDLIKVAKPEGAREILLNELIENSFKNGQWDAGAATQFVSRHRDKFKLASRGDNNFTNRVSRFTNALQVANRQLGNKSALKAEARSQETQAAIGIGGVAEASNLYKIRAATGFGITIGKHLFGKTMLDPESAEILIRLAKEEADSFGANLQTRKLVQSLGKKGLFLTGPAGGRMIINKINGKLEEDPSTVSQDSGGDDEMIGVLTGEKLR